MQNISLSTNKELALMGFNDYYFYQALVEKDLNKSQRVNYFLALLKEEYIFNNSQWKHLIEILKEDNFINNKEYKSLINKYDNQKYVIGG